MKNNSKEMKELHELAQLLIQLPKEKRERLKEGLKLGKILFSENDKKAG